MDPSVFSFSGKFIFNQRKSSSTIAVSIFYENQGLRAYMPTVPIFLRKRKSILTPEKIFEISLSVKLTNKNWVLTIKIFQCESGISQL